MSNMFLNVVSTFKGDGLNAATRQLGAFGSAAGGLGSTLGKVGAALASFGLAAKSIQFTQDSIESARDLERNLFSVNTIFGELAPTMVQFSENAENIGLSQKDAAKAVTFLGSVLKQSGFAMEDVVTESQKLVSLGVDLAATYGYDVQEALLGMTALFRGEYDPIEKFGVAMKQAEINAELQARGLHKLTGAALRNAEQTIRMELLYERAADASGAFTAQTGNLFVEQKKLSAQFENMQATVGTALLPAMGELVAALKPLVEQLTPRLVQVVTDAQPAIQIFTGLIEDMGDKTTTTGQTMNTLADILGTSFRLISENFGVLLQLTALFLGVRVAIALATTALAIFTAHPIIATLTLVAAGVILLNDQMKNLKYNTDTTGASVTSFNGKLKDLGKESDYVNKKYGAIGVTFGVATAEAKRLGEEVARADKAKLDNLKQAILGIKISAKEAANEFARMARYAGVDIPGADGGAGPGPADGGGSGGGGGAAPKPAAITGLPALIADAKKNAKVLKKQVTLEGKGLSQEVAKWVTSSNTPVKAANQALTRIAKNGDKAIKNLTKNYNKSAAGQQAAAAAFAQAEADRIAQQKENERIAEELRQAEEARLAEQKRVYESFLDSVKNTFSGIRNAIMGAFDITGLGSSTNSIMRNMEKMLVRLRSFSASVKQLATMGLDPALLQQIISMGPMAGARLASNLVAGGAGALAAINAGYGEFGSLASEIATTGTNALFGTQAQQNIYNINVDGGVGSGATIGKAIVDAIKAYERTSGAVWQGA
jgi:hypothetical protein